MKMQWVYRRVKFALWQFPKRVQWLFTYYFHPFYRKPKFRAFPLMLAECFFFFDLYEIISNLYKKDARPLTKDEILRGYEIFGDSVDYQLVMIDAHAELVTKSLGVAYVSFNTINSWGKMSADIFIHELVHVWQYQHFGAGYIANALVAQNTKEGYNYTDLKLSVWHKADSIHSFNGEQQGDLVRDYYRLKTGLTSEWGGQTVKDLPKFEKFIDEIRMSQI